MGASGGMGDLAVLGDPLFCSRIAVHLPQNGTIGFDPQPSRRKRARLPSRWLETTQRLVHGLAPLWQHLAQRAHRASAIYKTNESGGPKAPDRVCDTGWVGTEQAKNGFPDVDLTSPFRCVVSSLTKTLLCCVETPFWGC